MASPYRPLDAGIFRPPPAAIDEISHVLDLRHLAAAETDSGKVGRYRADTAGVQSLSEAPQISAAETEAVNQNDVRLTAGRAPADAVVALPQRPREGNLRRRGHHLAHALDLVEESKQSRLELPRLIPHRDVAGPGKDLEPRLRHPLPHCLGVMRGNEGVAVAPQEKNGGADRIHRGTRIAEQHPRRRDRDRPWSCAEGIQRQAGAERDQRPRRMNESLEVSSTGRARRTARRGDESQRTDAGWRARGELDRGLPSHRVSDQMHGLGEIPLEPANEQRHCLIEREREPRADESPVPPKTDEIGCDHGVPFRKRFEVEVPPARGAGKPVQKNDRRSRARRPSPE